MRLDGTQLFAELPVKNACPRALLLACLVYVTGSWNEECKCCKAAMIHYNVWFSIRSEADEQEALSAIHSFLRELFIADEIAGFQLLRNTGSLAETQILPFQALIEFRDDAQFSAAFSAQSTRGIHTGLHGRIMAVVADFRVGVFRQIAVSTGRNAAEWCHNYACEI